MLIWIRKAHQVLDQVRRTPSIRRPLSGESQFHRPYLLYRLLVKDIVVHRELLLRQTPDKPELFVRCLLAARRGMALG